MTVPELDRLVDTIYAALGEGHDALGGVRMTGGGETPEPQGMRKQPPVQSYDDDTPPSGDEERIEIPAFLRRQAN